MSAAELDRERLAKLCGMFGSDHAGERANAAAAADKLVRQAGARWSDVIRPDLPPPEDAVAEAMIRNTDPGVWFCLDHHPKLSDWESRFLWSLVDYGRPLSPRQQEVLDRLVAKAKLARRERAA